jgi:hypothetical protein
MVPCLDTYGHVNAKAGMFPIAHIRHNALVDSANIQQEGKNLFLPNLNRSMQPDIGDMDEMAGWRENAFGDDCVHMTMPVDQVAEGLNGSDHCGNTAVAVDFQSVNVTYRFPGRAAELAQQISIEPEENPKPLWNRENPLPVRHVGKHFLLETMRKQ